MRQFFNRILCVSATLLATNLLTAKVYAEEIPGLALGQPTYAGVGCPQSSVSAVLSPDNLSLSVLFDQFQIRVGMGAPLRAAVGCELRIPLFIPTGYQVSLLQFDYRGFISLPKNTFISFLTMASVTDVHGRLVHPMARVIKNNQFIGPQTNEVLLNGALQKNQSGCGGDYQLSSSIMIQTATNAQGEEVLAGIDSGDITAQPVIYKLAWVKCKTPQTPPPRVLPGPRPMPPRPNIPAHCFVNPQSPMCRTLSR